MDTGLSDFLTAMKRKGSVNVVDIENELKVEKISTGVPELDRALGGGGLPETSVVELYGVEMSAKTTLGLIMASKNQENNVICWLDFENSFNRSLAESLGVDLYKNFVVVKPESFEEGADVIDTFLEKTKVRSIIFVDSLAWMTVSKVLEEGHEGATSPILAKKLGPALQKWMHLIRKTKSLLVFINHKKELINMSGWSSGAKVFVTPGGKSIKYAANVRLDFNLKEFIYKTINGDRKKVGQKLKIVVTKNRFAAPYDFAEVNLIFGKGVFSDEQIKNGDYERIAVEDTKDIKEVDEESLPSIDVMTKKRGRPSKSVTDNV